MRLAFLGSAVISIPTLRACAAVHEVVTVVTAPVRPGNRGAPAPQPVADVARELDITVMQPMRLRRDGTEQLLTMNLDALVLFAYGQILPQRLLDGPRFGGVNVHPSLLPRWRGASPVSGAILAGDEETGVCIMRMEAGLDTGPVYARAVVPMPPGATTPGLSTLLGDIGATMAVQVLESLEAGLAVAAPQAEAGSTYAPLLQREDSRISWLDRSADEVDRHVRAMQPWPGTTAPLGGLDVRITAGECDVSISADVPPGNVIAVERDAVVVATRSGAYRVRDVQPPGRRPMDAASYWRGRRLSS